MYSRTTFKQKFQSYSQVKILCFPFLRRKKICSRKWCRPQKVVPPPEKLLPAPPISTVPYRFIANRPKTVDFFYCLHSLTKIIDHFATKYDNHLIMGNFNMQSDNSIFKCFLDSNNPTNLIKNNTCFKRVVN